MTELEEQKGKGYLKETIHGMLRRCEGWDYSLPCIYMITLVLANRRSKVLGGWGVQLSPIISAITGLPSPTRRGAN